jgi:hypothetical protein
VRAGPVGEMAKRPAAGSSSAASSDGLSGRGQHSQSIEPPRDTSAAERQLPMSA